MKGEVISNERVNYEPVAYLVSRIPLLIDKLNMQADVLFCYAYVMLCNAFSVPRIVLVDGGRCRHSVYIMMTILASRLGNKI